MTIVVDTDNEGIPCTGGRPSPAAENTAREDTRPPANDTNIISGRHNNWNTATNEFVYREIYARLKEEDK